MYGSPSPGTREPPQPRGVEHHMMHRSFPLPVSLPPSHPWPLAVRSLPPSVTLKGSGPVARGTQTHLRLRPQPPSRRQPALLSRSENVNAHVSGCSKPPRERGYYGPSSPSY